MSRAYLLIGDKGVGKSTALMKIIKKIGLSRCGGFYAEEVRVDNVRTGFQIVTLDGRVGSLASIHSDSTIRVGGKNEKGIGKYGVDLEFLETTAIGVLYEAIEDDNVACAIIDEIGPMQLYSNKFKKAVIDVMNSRKVLIGTIVLRPYPWADEFKQRDDVETFLFTFNNRNNMTKMLSWFFSNLNNLEG